MWINALFSISLLLLPVVGSILTEASSFWALNQLLILISALFTLKYITNKTSRIIALVIFVIIFHSLNSAYFFSYFLQNKGFNDAFFYHLKPDLLFAGVGEFFYLIIFECLHWLALLITAFIIAKRQPVKNKMLLSKRYLIPTLLLLIITWPPFFSMQTHISNKVMGNSAYQVEALQILEEINAEKLMLSTGDTPPNIILLYLESVEQAYFDDDYFPGLMPEMNKIKANSINFTGLEQADKAGWTIAGMVATQCGYPLVAPFKNESQNTASVTASFMQNARCHGDLLKENGYHLTFIGGADHRFAGKGKFYESHQYDEILGRSELTKKLADRKYTHGWGLFDDSLFDIAFEKFEKLSSNKKPFNLSMVTVDTHHPTGNPSKSCTPYDKGNNSMLDSVHCTDQLASQFINKIRNSKYSQNTVIAVVSDHLAMRNNVWKKLNNYPEGRKLTYFVNFPDNRHGIIKNKGAHFDVMPTLYELLNFDLKGQFGFGQSLLAKDGYLIEKANNIDAVNNDFLQNFVAKLWGNKVIKINNKGISLASEGRDIKLGGENYDLRSDGWGETASTVFEFDAQMNVLNIDIASWSGGVTAQKYIDLLLNNSDSIYLVITKQKYMKAFVQGYEDNELVYYFGSGSGVFFETGKLSKKEKNISYQQVEQVFENLSSERIFNKRKADLISFSQLLRKERISALLMTDKSLKVKSQGGNAEKGIVIDAGKQVLEPQRGLNIYQLDKDFTATFIANYDACRSKSIYKKEPSLDVVLSENKRKDSDWFLLVGQDSLHCEKAAAGKVYKKGMKQWINNKFHLPFLSEIKYRDPYIGLINLKSMRSLEMEPGNKGNILLEIN